MTAAARQRLHRERERRGVVVLQVAVSEIELGEQLVEAGLLHRDEVDDRNRLRAAVEHMLELWADTVTRDSKR